jgi:hypothetical protein
MIKTRIDVTKVSGEFDSLGIANTKGGVSTVCGFD